MKFFDSDIVLKELPDEISLCFSMVGCPHNCFNCHWKNIDIKHVNELNKDVAKELSIRYKNKISCVLFLGGEWDKELIDIINVFKEYGYKTALYTGLDFEQVDIRLIEILDYIKVGRYIDDLGGLESEITNQVLYKLDTMENINYKFWRK